MNTDSSQNSESPSESTPHGLHNRLMQRLYDYFFCNQNRTAFWVWAVLLYIGGTAVWIYFLNGGRIDFSFHDWYEITGPRLYFLKDSITQGILPLHMNGTSALILLTDRYLAIPDMLLSPQVLLLRWLEPGPFILINWLILYSIGFWGLLVFARRYQLSPFVFSIVFLLFNFNGHIEAHLAVGHNTWDGYFLLPWFVIWVLEIPQARLNWRWVAKVSALVFLIFLQGSFHLVVYLLFFLAFLALANISRFWPILSAAGFATLLSAVRIVPAALILNTVNQDSYGGFPDVWQALTALFQLRDYLTPVQGVYRAFYAWEYDYYVGLAGAAILIYFGIYRWLKTQKISLNLFIPLTGLFLFSLGEIYRVWELLPVPIYETERMTTRFFVLPLVFLLFIAAIHMQEWFVRQKPGPLLAPAAVLTAVILCSDLWVHTRLWAVESIRLSLADTLHSFYPSDWINANYPDSLYSSYLRRGLLITLASALLLTGLAWLNPPWSPGYFLEKLKGAFHSDAGSKIPKANQQD